MSVGLHLTGHAPRRGLAFRSARPAELADEIAAWLASAAPEVTRRVGRDQPDASTVVLRASFHPAAGDVEIRLAGGRVSVLADTAPVGPGYHTWLSRHLRRLGAELVIDWRAPRRDAAPEDETGYFRTDDRGAAQRGLLRWLHGELRRAADPRGRRWTPHHVGAFPGHRFQADGVLVTALGPRDAGWLAAALKSPRQAVDVWPWATDAMDPRYLLDRALCLLWTGVRWRPPVTAEERGVIEEALRLLRRAFGLDPNLPYPWREWRDLLGLVGHPVDPLTERVAVEAARAPALPAIGYRRGPVTVVHEGWQLTVPGGWAESRAGSTWRGGEGGRSVTVVASRLGGPGAPATPGAYLERHAGELGAGALTHRAGPLVGRGEVIVSTTSGIEVTTLRAWSAAPGLGAAVSIEFHDPANLEWALDMWRSLVPVP